MANKTYKYIRRNQNPIDHHLYNDAEYTLLEFGYDSKGHRKSIVVVDEDGSVYDIYNWMEEIRGDKKEEKRLMKVRDIKHLHQEYFNGRFC